jgi:glutathione S-transferase
VEICLAQAKADYKKYEVDLTSKPRPEWYTKHINPTGQAPAMTYGGPDVPLDQPSPESAKLRESG